MEVSPTYDDFIRDFKKKLKVGSNSESQLEGLLLQLMKKLKVKSELDLIKLYRISLAHSAKDSLKDQIRGKLIQEAILKVKQPADKNFISLFELGRPDLD